MEDTRWSERWIDNSSLNKADRSQMIDSRPRLPSLSSLLTSKSGPRPEQRSQNTLNPSTAGDEKGMDSTSYPSLSPATEHGAVVRPELQGKFENLGGLHYSSSRPSSEQQIHYPGTSFSARRRDTHEHANYKSRDSSTPHMTESRAPDPSSRTSATLQAHANASVNMHPSHNTGARSSLAAATDASNRRLAMPERPVSSRLLHDRYHRSEPNRPPPRPPSGPMRPFHSDGASIPRSGAPRWPQNFPERQETARRDSLFDRLLDVFLAARQYNHTPSTDGSPASGSPPAFPPVRQGDVSTLRRCLELELDRLHATDPRMAKHLNIEWHNLLDQSTRPDVYGHYIDERPSQSYDAGPMHASESPSLHADRQRRNTAHRFDPYGHDRFGDYSPATQYDDRTELYSMEDERGYGGGGERESFPLQGRSSSVSPRNYYATPQGPSPSYGVQGGPYAHAHYVAAAPLPKRVRKRRDELDQVCLSCSASETPEWRKGPTGPRTLCNACGLLFAKQCRKRDSVIQLQSKRVKGVRPHGPERMTNEERENSLLELQMAVQARSNQAQNLGGAGPSLSSTTFNRPLTQGVDGHRE